MPHLDLASLGWDAGRQADFTPYASQSLDPGRVSRVDRSAYDVVIADGTLRATGGGAVLSAGAAEPGSLPCVGDWVAVRRWPDGRATVEVVMQRRTAFVRLTVTPGVSRGQVLAANVDVALVVEGLLPEPDLGRIERFLALVWECGTQPVVVLTKADLVTDAEQLREDVAGAAPGAEVLVVSAVTGAGLEALSPYVGPGRTAVLLGPSGAGKSTLVNRLAGEELMVTSHLRADGKGRHTTTHRELLALPSGGVLIDTPGLRSVGLFDADAGLGRAFADIEELAADCRFDDCAHRSEPGCAVNAAVENGELPARRLDSWRKLQREAEYMAARTDARLRAEQRRRWKAVGKSVRQAGITRP